MKDEPFSPNQTRDLCRNIIEKGGVKFSNHALEQMRTRDLSQLDCTNVLRAGHADQAEPHGSNWRYQIHTTRMCVVVAFQSENRLTVVTAWRKN